MNKFFITLFYFLFSTICICQNFHGGIIVGASTSQVSGDGLSGFNKIGPRFGIYINQEIDWYGVQLELQYITKGSKKKTNSSNPNDNNNNLSFYSFNNYNFHLEYVGVPILFFSKIRKNIKLELGTSFNFIIKQSEEIDFYLDSSNEVHNFEADIILGITYPINNKILLNTRISNSISPIRPHASGETYRLNRGQYNTVLCFNLYYKLY